MLNGRGGKRSFIIPTPVPKFKHTCLSPVDVGEVVGRADFAKEQAKLESVLRVLSRENRSTAAGASALRAMKQRRKSEK